MKTPFAPFGIGQRPGRLFRAALCLAASLGSLSVGAQTPPTGTPPTGTPPTATPPTATPPADPALAVPALPSPDDTARRDAAAAFEQGQRAFSANDFPSAAEYFETADQLMPAPPATVNAIRSHRGVHTPQHDARAATLALRLLTRYADDTRVTSYAYRIIDELSPTLGRLTVRCQNCELSVDQTSSDSNVFVEAGHHSLVALWGARTASREIDVAAGATVSVDMPPPPPENSAAAVDPYGLATDTTPGSGANRPPTPVEPPTPPRVDPPPSGGGLPAGVFAVGTVLTLGLGGALVWSALDTLSGRDVYVLNPTQTALDDGRSREMRTNLLIGATAAMGATTLLIGAFFTRWRSHTVQASPSVQAMNGAAPGLTVMGSF